MCSRLQKPRDDALGQNRLAQLSIVLFFSVVIYAAVIAFTFFFSFVSFRIDNRLHFFFTVHKTRFRKALHGALVSVPAFSQVYG